MTSTLCRCGVSNPTWLRIYQRAKGIIYWTVLKWIPAMHCCWHLLFPNHLVKYVLFYSKDVLKLDFSPCKNKENQFWGQEQTFNCLNGLSPYVYLYLFSRVEVLCVFSACFFCIFLTILAVRLLLIFIWCDINK